ncbi:hypothetical protein RFI_15992, partial [Reticulomyxa filosa]
YLLELKNYFSFMAITAALASPEIKKLNYAWMVYLFILKKNNNNLFLKKKSPSPSPPLFFFVILITIENALTKLMQVSTALKAKNKIEQLQPPGIPCVEMMTEGLPLIDGMDDRDCVDFEKYSRFWDKCDAICSFQLSKYQQQLVQNPSLCALLEQEISTSSKVPEKFIQLLVQPAVELDQRQTAKSDKGLSDKEESAKLKVAHQQTTGAANARSSFLCLFDKRCPDQNHE